MNFGGSVLLPMNSSALVLFSGGQDSTTCLAWALSRYDHVETVGFDYGQRHRVELQCRAPVIARIKAEFPQWVDKIGDDQVIHLANCRITLPYWLRSESPFNNKDARHAQTVYRC